MFDALEAEGRQAATPKAAPEATPKATPEAAPQAAPAAAAAPPARSHESPPAAPRPEAADEPMADLPLFTAGGEPEPAPPAPGLPHPEPPPPADDLRAPAPAAAAAPDLTLDEQPEPEMPATAGVTITDRLLAGLIDVGAHAVVGLLLLTGAALVGVRPVPLDLVPVALFLLVFSFFYTVVPLIFWGRTPGMMRGGLAARDTDGGKLTYAQAAWRWLGGVLTVVLAGLPLLLAVQGRSLADLLSGSRTEWV